MIFNTSQVLCVATGAFFGDIDGIYQILSYMTQDTIYTHQIPRALDECQPHILKQLPWLVGVKKEVDSIRIMDPYEASRILAISIAKYGDEHEVSPIPRDDHDIIDPAEELKRMRGGSGDDVIVVRPDPSF